MIAISFALALLTGLLAWRLGSLTLSGAIAAGVVGGLILGLGGWAWAAALLLFFASSSALSRLFPARRARVADEIAGQFEKGDRRDWGQVAANGGLGAALAVVHALLPEAAWPWIAFLGAVAAANADTWATELGVLNRRPPRLITSGRKVEPGTSGGVSGLGILASLAGAALIGSLGPLEGTGAAAFAAVTFGGLAASLFDSLLGATVQAIYFCPEDEKETEQHPLHACGARTRLVRGWGWLNNDLVNLAASVAGSAIALSVWMIGNFF